VAVVYGVVGGVDRGVHVVLRLLLEGDVLLRAAGTDAAAAAGECAPEPALSRQ
jgi:hypothetical protein